MEVKPSWLSPLVALAAVPLLLPLVSAPLQEAHMIAIESVELVNWRMGGKGPLFEGRFYS